MNEINCALEDLAKSELFSGKVEEKFIDYKNHRYKTLVINDKGNKTITKTLDSEINNTFDSLMVGDSI